MSVRRHVRAMAALALASCAHGGANCTTVCDRCVDDFGAPWTDPVTDVAPNVSYRVSAWSLCGLQSPQSDPFTP